MSALTEGGKTSTLNVCAVGDPRSPATWSGTPLNLCNALERAGHLGCAFNVQAPSLMEGPLHRVSSFAYGKEDLQRGVFLRSIRSLMAVRRTGQSASRSTLHTTTFSLPFLRQPSNQSHFLYCDTTWSLWRRQERETAARSEELCLDAERLEQRSYQQMQHIFTTAAYVRDELIDHYNVSPDRVTAVGTGRGGIAPFFGEKDYSAGRLLFVAKERFEDKGGPLLIKAFERARRLSPTLTLDIVGQGERRSTLPLIDGLTVHGFLPKDQLQRLFEQASLFVMPAGNEPWGLVFLEALACQTPILALNRNAAPEIAGAGKFGWLVDEESPEEVSRVIIDACSKPAELAQKGALGQDHCLTNFTWDHTIEKILNLAGLV